MYADENQMPCTGGENKVRVKKNIKKKGNKLIMIRGDGRPSKAKINELFAKASSYQALFIISGSRRLLRKKFSGYSESAPRNAEKYGLGSRVSST